MTDVDDWDDHYPDDEPDEPDWWWYSETPPPVGRERRRVARRWRHQLRVWRKTGRHEHDRFWQARNPRTFDDEAPF